MEVDFDGPGLVYLLINSVGWIVTVFLLGIQNMILGLMALIDGDGCWISRGSSSRAAPLK